MDSIEKRARELLAAAYDAEGFARHAAKTRGGLKFTAVYEEVVMRALIAAIMDSESDVGIPISVPEGYALVPVEPTEAMLNSGLFGLEPMLHVSDIRAIYDDMLSARPEVP